MHLNQLLIFSEALWKRLEGQENSIPSPPNFTWRPEVHLKIFCNAKSTQSKGFIEQGLVQYSVAVQIQGKEGYLYFKFSSFIPKCDENEEKYCTIATTKNKNCHFWETEKVVIGLFICGGRESLLSRSISQKMSKSLPGANTISLQPRVSGCYRQVGIYLFPWE